MLRENWRDWRFWQWWWKQRVPADAKLMTAMLALLVLLVGGYFASSHLTGSTPKSKYVLQTTITKVVTVNDHGRTVVKRMPVRVLRTVQLSTTAFDTTVETRVVTTPGGTRVVTKPGGTRVVTQSIVRTVPVHGKTVSQNVTSIVTNQQTVTQPVTSMATRTVTLPPDTVTRTQTQTQTQVQTVTRTQTVVETVTEPAVTITVSVPTLTLP
ncbi:MAG TPA: hypothetical protein VFJ93_08505 [Gaiellaceae bacterium]|nr:hypothetical protein [Gaiellaceae bacterium]